MTASSSPTKRFQDRLTKLATQIASPIHRFLYRVSNGAIGGTLMGEKILLLTTTGRKSGQARTMPLLYMTDGDRLVLIASNGGQDRHPAWYLNLLSNPQATVEIGREKRTMRAEDVQGAERERLWEMVKNRAPLYKRYESSTTRQIPIVLLHPEGKA